MEDNIFQELVILAQENGSLLRRNDITAIAERDLEIC
jgi:hypothetical protein